MLRLSVLSFGLCVLASSFAMPSQAAPTSTAVDTAANPASTACGDIISTNEKIFRASDVKACLLSVPFNSAVATRFIAYYKDTLQFQSTLGYLKSPPSSYQQPATDLLGGLDNIQIGIDNGAYKDQYTFEVALQKVIFSAHDDHLTLVSGILGVFQFGAGVYIASVSKDGISLPEPYLVDDLSKGMNDSSFVPSPISKINGRDAVEYLRQFCAENALGALETHTEYNLLMSSPASDIQEFYSTWAGDANFYPPDDELDILLADGTHYDPFPFLAIYNGPLETGPLLTGGDFYNFFVLGQYPASYNPYANWNATEEDEPSATSEAAASATAESAVPSTTEAGSEPTATGTDSTPSATPSSWYPNIAYPWNPDVTQRDLGTYGGGFVSGYLLKDASIAVLSIPSFKASEDGLNEFSSAVREFLLAGKNAGMKKVVIDLQQNFGGVTMLAFDTFRQFFPTIDPYGGSRLRAHGPANAMGSAITKYFDTLTETDEDYYDLYANEWVSSKRLDAITNHTFATWAEEYGPHPSNGDNFTTVQRFDLADTLFNTLSVGNPDDVFTVYGYGDRPVNASQPYAANDIVILSDSICASTCAMFMEMMHHEAGVRTVVAGGLPAYGPMQAPGLTRGARLYGVTDTLDENIEYAEAVLEYFKDDNPHILRNRTDGLSMSVTSAGINLRDQVRKDQDMPLQFVYEAADCRIFFTPKTFYNYTALWEYTADAMWGSSGKCVKDSTGYSTVNMTKTAAPAQAVLPPANPPPVPKLGAIINEMLGVAELKTEPVTSEASPIPAIEGSACKWNPTVETCPLDFYCVQYYAKSCVNGITQYISACAKICPTNDDSYCVNNCQPFLQTPTEKKFKIAAKQGYCEPSAPCKKKRALVGSTSAGVERPPPGLKRV